MVDGWKARNGLGLVRSVALGRFDDARAANARKQSQVSDYHLRALSPAVRYLPMISAAYQGRSAWGLWTKTASFLEQACPRIGEVERGDDCKENGGGDESHFEWQSCCVCCWW